MVCAVPALKRLLEAHPDLPSLLKEEMKDIPEAAEFLDKIEFHETNHRSLSEETMQRVKGFLLGVVADKDEDIRLRKLAVEAFARKVYSDGTSQLRRIYDNYEELKPVAIKTLSWRGLWWEDPEAIRKAIELVISEDNEFVMPAIENLWDAVRLRGWDYTWKADKDDVKFSAREIKDSLASYLNEVELTEAPVGRLHKALRILEIFEKTDLEHRRFNQLVLELLGKVDVAGRPVGGFARLEEEEDEIKLTSEKDLQRILHLSTKRLDSFSKPELQRLVELGFAQTPGLTFLNILRNIQLTGRLDPEFIPLKTCQVALGFDEKAIAGVQAFYQDKRLTADSPVASYLLEGLFYALSDEKFKNSFGQALALYGGKSENFKALSRVVQSVSELIGRRTLFRATYRISAIKPGVCLAEYRREKKLEAIPKDSFLAFLKLMNGNDQLMSLVASIITLITNPRGGGMRF